MEKIVICMEKYPVYNVVWLWYMRLSALISELSLLG
jgi:hypothetical protein